MKKLKGKCMFLILAIATFTCNKFIGNVNTKERGEQRK